MCIRDSIATWLDKCRNGHVTGLDYSEVSVAESQELNAAAIKQGKCRVLQGDVSAIPFSDEDVYKRQELLHALTLGAGVVVAIAFQKIDGTPNTQARTQGHNQGLKNFDRRVEEFHSRFLLN